MTFALNAKLRLPRNVLQPAPYQDDPGFTIDPTLAERGAGLFAVRCSVCHGFSAMAGGTAPHLLRSTVALDLAALDSVVRGGALLANGMPAYPELTETDVSAIMHYLRQRARVERADEKSSR